MENIPLPTKVEIKPGEDKNSATIIIEPCFPGYGTTLGNALRRILLSSLPGAAVTAFKVKGASHEFSYLDYIKEDLVDIALNLKQLRAKVFSEQPVRLKLKVKGEKEVTAKDIKTTSDVEIVNPDLHLATLTDKKAELDMEIVIAQGRGYQPTEAREVGELEVGMIAIDSLFSPIQKIGFKVENVRVGQMTNWDRLILDIETDGTITPREALNEATKYLIDNFRFIRDHTAESAEEKKPEVKSEKKVAKKKKEKKEKAEEDKNKKTKTPSAQKKSRATEK